MIPSIERAYWSALAGARAAAPRAASAIRPEIESRVASFVDALSSTRHVDDVLAVIIAGSASRAEDICAMAT